MSRKVNPLHIKPVVSRVIIKVDKVEEKTAGGVYLGNVERKQNEQDTGIIISHGIDAFVDWHESETPKVGDSVVFARYSGGSMNYELNGEQYRIVNPNDIAGIIMEDKENA